MRRFPAIPLMSALVIVLSLAGCGSDETDAADTSAASSAGSDDSGSSGDGEGTTTLPPQLFSSDFETVCAGATQSRATAYAAGEPGPHKLILLQGPKGKMYESTIDIPEDWQAKWAAEGDELAKIQLVACSELVPGDVVKTCDGYEDSDGAKLDTKIDLRNASYRVSLRAATTGDEVASTVVEATAEDCPMVISADDTESFADNNLAIVEFLRPYVQGA